jgi:hypothetical protein
MPPHPDPNPPPIPPPIIGEEKPVAPNKNSDSNDNPEGRAQNRRVQITVEK